MINETINWLKNFFDQFSHRHELNEELKKNGLSPMTKEEYHKFQDDLMEREIELDNWLDELGQYKW
jgi:folate-dependent tRNA-U54 methylase TrmFO/GidA